MRAVVMDSPGLLHVEDVEDPRIFAPTDAVIRIVETCICGSDLWKWRGVSPVSHQRMGHEYIGVVEETGSQVLTVKEGDFVIGSFMFSCNVCKICRSGYQSYCVQGGSIGQVSPTQAQRARVPLADGTLISTPEMPDKDLLPSLLAASDVFGTGWFGAVAANVLPGGTVVIIGDGAVGLEAILACRQLGAEIIIAMSKYEDRQRLAYEFGATYVFEERGEDAVTRVKELTNGLGSPSVIEAVGTPDSMAQAIRTCRPGGHIGFLGVPHGDGISAQQLFAQGVHLHGGLAPVRRFLPDLIDMIWRREVNPGRVFDLVLPLDKAKDGYQAMDERQAIKVRLIP